MAALKGHTKVSSILNAQPGSIFTGGKGNYIPFMNGEKAVWIWQKFWEYLRRWPPDDPFTVGISGS